MSIIKPALKRSRLTAKILRQSIRPRSSGYRAKIGQLAMDDEIRQEAMRPFLSGDQTSSVWSPKAKDRVRESVDS